MKWNQNIRKEADLKIDCDTHRANPIKRFNFRLRYLMQYFPRMSPCKIIVYRTKKGFHFYVYWNAYFYVYWNTSIGNDTEKVLFQVLLGSDWLRELRNYNRINKGDTNWNLLFSVKEKNGKTKTERFYCSYVLKAGSSHK